MKQSNRTKAELIEEIKRLSRQVQALSSAVRGRGEGGVTPLPACEDEKRTVADLERYRDFVQSIEDGCFEVDLHGTLTFINQAMCRIHGYPSEKLLGMNYKAFSMPEDAKNITETFRQTYKTGIPSRTFDYSIRRPDGSLRHIEVLVALMRDAQSKPIGFRGIARDRTASQAETDRLNTLVNQAHRLEAIGTLAAGVAHNFNNLLMSIQGCVSLILMGIDASHPHFQRLKAIEGHIKRGADLTVQLLGYASGSRRSVQTAQINQIVDTAAVLFGRKQPDVRIFQKHEASLWPVAVDRQQMEHVFMNLFVNAGQAMAEGGSLYIETQNVLLNDAFVRAFDRKPGKYVKITVTDTGIGMDAATRERIFEPFFSTRNFSRGAGLGLASVYGIVKSHQGIITVQSEKGKGATFSIHLPAIMPPAEVKAGPLPPKPEHAPETILIVDDERVIVDVTRKMLSGSGYETLAAFSGKEAVEIFMANPGRIDLVIMDIVMPGIGGDQAVEMIRAISPEIKVIMMSGYLESVQGGSKESIQRHGGAFLQKPFRAEVLCETIQALLGS